MLWKYFIEFTLPSTDIVFYRVIKLRQSIQNNLSICFEYVIAPSINVNWTNTALTVTGYGLYWMQLLIARCGVNKPYTSVQYEAFFVLSVMNVLKNNMKRLSHICYLHIILSWGWWSHTPGWGDFSSAAPVGEQSLWSWQHLAFPEKVFVTERWLLKIISELVWVVSVSFVYL